MIDPLAFSLGPIPIRWYGIAYVVSILVTFIYAKKIFNFFYISNNLLINSIDTQNRSFDTFITWIMITIIVGGRIGYILFYEPIHFSKYPLDTILIWKGGMSFHGGLFLITITSFWICKRNNIPFLITSDIISTIAPIGIFFGRIANFINSEHYGKPSHITFSIIFPNGGPYPRHPFQLYEAMLEGLLLFICLKLIWSNTSLPYKKPGTILGFFYLTYGMFRIFVEIFKEENYSVTLFNIINLGQILSIPFVITGVYIVFKNANKK